MQSRLSTPTRVQAYWREIASYGTAQNVSTLTTLLAFTDYGTEYKSLCVYIENDDGANNVNLVIDVSHGGTYKVTEMSTTVAVAAQQEGYAYIGDTNPFTYIRIAAQTDSPGFPTVQIKWALLGIPR